MRRRAIAVAGILCLLGGVGFWTLEWTTRRYRLPNYHCHVPAEFDDRYRNEAGYPTAPHRSLYFKYRGFHQYGWRNAMSEWLGGTKAKSTPISTSDFEIRAMTDGKQQFHRDKESLIRLPDLSN